MNTPRQEIEARVAQAVHKLFSPAPAAPYVRPCPDERHGDFQTNVALVQAKEAKANPRELAAKLAEALELDDVAEKPEIAGPGFLNIRLKTDYLAKQVTERWSDDRLGIPVGTNTETLVLDYKQPEHRQGNACRPFAQHGARRCLGPDVSLSRLQGHCR